MHNATVGSKLQATGTGTINTPNVQVTLEVTGVDQRWH
jgi:hypothetical protein